VQVIEYTIGIHHIMRFKVRGRRLVNIEQNYFETRKSLAKSVHALRSTVRARHDTASVDKEIGVIADAGPNFKDASAGERQSKACEMFLASPIVALILLVKKAI
jgi:hypothetical protein